MFIIYLLINNSLQVQHNKEDKRCPQILCWEASPQRNIEEHQRGFQDDTGRQTGRDPGQQGKAPAEPEEDRREQAEGRNSPGHQQLFENQENEEKAVKIHPETWYHSCFKVILW